MFRITNLSNGQQRDFQNREELEFFLEGEENRCLQLNTTATFQLFHLDKNEELLESMELTIPSSGEQDVKELLGDFGLKKTKKFFFSRGTKQEKTQRVQKKKHELSTANENMSKSGSLSTVVGDEKLTSREDQIGPLFMHVQSDEDTLFKVDKVSKTEAQTFDVFDQLISRFQFCI